MVSLIAELKAKPGNENLLVEEITKLTEETRKESGCIAYIPHISVDDPAKIYIFEQYVDQAALDFHAQSSHFKAVFAEKGDELLDGPLKVKMLKEFA